MDAPHCKQVHSEGGGVRVCVRVRVRVRVRMRVRMRV